MSARETIIDRIRNLLKLSALSALSVLFFSACTQSQALPTVTPSPTQVALPTATSVGPPINVSVSIHNGDVITADFQGIGTEFDPFGFMPENTDKGFSDKDWAIISDRVKRMKPGIVRMWFQPDWHEPNNDDSYPNHINWNGFTFDSVRMRSLYKYLDLCEAAGCKVNIVFGWKRAQPQLSWLGFQNVEPPVASAPSNLDEWAESASALLQYLLNVKGYKSVQYLTSFNEPNSKDDFVVPSDYDEKDWYGQMYKKIDERLRRDGIRSKIKLVAPDVGCWGTGDGCDSWLDYTLKNMDDVIDVYAAHQHTRNADELGSFIDSWKAKISSTRPKGSSKPFYLAEFGGVRDSALRDSYEHGLILADLVITALNHGTSAMTRWRLSDIYLVAPIARAHNPSDLIYSGIQEQGLWAYRDKGWMPRYSYYAYSLMTRYTQAGSSILRTTSSNPDIRVSTIKSPAGKYSLLFLNKGQLDANVSVRFDFALNVALDRHVYDSSVVPSVDANIIPANATIEASAGFSDTIPAKSLVVYEQSSE